MSPPRPPGCGAGGDLAGRSRRARPGNASPHESGACSIGSSTPDKLHHVIPEITGEPSIKGTAYWERFVRVRRMRDALVHVKEGNYSADPDNPSTYGMLLRGDADDCVLDVCALITKHSR